jgi:DNA-directed RNA polymerase
MTAKRKTKGAIQQAAAGTAAGLMLGGNHQAERLSALIEEARNTVRRGPRPQWIQALPSLASNQELAGLTLYRIAMALHQDEEDDAPYARTVAEGIASDLRIAGTDKERAAVGLHLLDLAAQAGFIQPVHGGEGARDGIRDGIRIKAVDGGALARMVSGAKPFAAIASLTMPDMPVRTKVPRKMVTQSRPDAIGTHQRTGQRLQQTAWRINRYVLDALPEEGLPREEDIIRKEAGVIDLVADAYVPDAVYFPVYTDYRGRFNQRGGMLQWTGGRDLARGLLEFNVGRPCTPEGLKWLSWYVASLCKAPNLAFGEVTPVQALAAVEQCPAPKKPWQLRAALHALKEAVAGNPVHYPVTLDCSCSGLQHLALLARDESLAPNLNLYREPDDLLVGWLHIPENDAPDFYRLVEQRIGNSVSRDQVKAVIVPMLYTAQVRRCATALAALEDRPTATPADKETAKLIWKTARTLAQKPFEVLDWFGQVADAFNAKQVPLPDSDRHTAAPIAWRTPSGFEPLQDYGVLNREATGPRLRIHSGGKAWDFRNAVFGPWLNRHQQARSFPSSLVHSMDAALLALTVDKAPGITQWAVAHDAFGVHPNDVGVLVEACRAALLDMYQPDRLAEWTAAWRAAGVDVPEPPQHQQTLPETMTGGLRFIS